MTIKKYVLTAKHRAQLEPWARKWIDIAMRVRPMDDEDRAKMREAIIGMYAAAGKEAPRIVFVPSPLVGAFASGFAAAIWHKRKGGSYAATYAATDDATRDATYAATYDATYAATRDATDDATYAATYAATRDATDAATYDATRAATRDATDDATYAATDDATRDATRAATRDATYDATRAATYAATDDATDDATYDLSKWYVYRGNIKQLSNCLGLGIFGLKCAQSAYRFRQGGNQWAGWSAFLSFFRHVAKLPIDYSKWQHWETATIHGGPRYVHEKFCIISDFPEVLKVDEQNRPHCETGPFCRWRDGFALYAWHGTRIPAWFIEKKSELTAAKALAMENLEERRAACEILGWSKILEELDAKVIDKDHPRIGTLLEAEVPDSGRERFLKVECGTGREFVLLVDKDVETAFAANMSTYPQLASLGIAVDELRKGLIENRT